MVARFKPQTHCYRQKFTTRDKTVHFTLIAGNSNTPNMKRPRHLTVPGAMSF
ncbi:MAG: hypothetical protein IT366_02010 [Candidatus Hydrogenedentes bacterium]|nr:hypothetical protein [Candidatus Hydrogenedentota bacterium]